MKSVKKCSSPAYCGLIGFLYCRFGPQGPLANPHASHLLRSVVPPDTPGCTQHVKAQARRFVDPISIKYKHCPMTNYPFVYVVTFVLSNKQFQPYVLA